MATTNSIHIATITDGNGREFEIRRVGNPHQQEGGYFTCSGFTLMGWRSCRFWCVHKELARIDGKGLKVKVETTKQGRAYWKEQATWAEESAPQTKPARKPTRRTRRAA